MVNGTGDAESPDRLSDEYSRQYAQLLQSRLAVGFCLAMAANLAYMFSDWINMGEAFPAFFTLRITAILGSGILFILNRSAMHRAFQEALTVTAALFLVAVLEFAVFHTAPFIGPVVMGMFLVLVGALVLIPIGSQAAWTIALGSVAIYLIPILVKPTDLPPGIYLRYLSPLVAGNAILLVANHLSRRTFKTQVFLRAQVEMREADLKRQAEHLEEQVAARTEELADSEARYRSLVESNPGLIYTLGRKGEYTFVGPKCKEMTGYEPEDFLGKSFIDFIDPHDHDKCIVSFKGIRDLGRPAMQAEYRMLRKDGTARVFHSYSAPYLNPYGAVEGMIGTAVDVTAERKVAEEREEYRKNLEYTLKRLQNASLDAVRALAGAIEAKDPYTRGHAERVGRLAVAIARQMSLTEEELEAIEFASVLHDVGKIGVKGVVLNKIGPLTDEEYEHIKIHPVLSEAIIKDASILAPTRPLVRAHHERYDGRGYPDGLAGENIPLAARIMAVADAYDAMCSRRPYRAPLGGAEALRRILNSAGSQFDPQVVEAFLDVTRQASFDKEYNNMYAIL